MKQLQFDFDNVPGIDYAYAIPLSSFRRVRHDYAIGKNALEVRDRDNIIRIESFNDKFSFQEKKSQSDGGDFWDVSIRVSVPKLFSANEDLIHQLERNTWLVLFRNKNGSVILSGTVEIPLVCSSSKNADNGVELVFSSKQENPSIFVSTDID